MQFTLHQLLKVMIDNGASDLHVTSNTPPQLRIDGSMVPLKTEMIRGGVQSLRMAGIAKILEGVTTPEEVLRTTVED